MARSAEGQAGSAVSKLAITSLSVGSVGSIPSKFVWIKSSRTVSQRSTSRSSPPLARNLAERVCQLAETGRIHSCDAEQVEHHFPRRPTFKSSRRAACTGAADSQAHLQALEAGADDSLPKPLAFPELRARVRSAGRMKCYVDELDNAAASIVMLGATIEARDRHTNGHCQRLAGYASALGRRIGLDRHDIRALEQGGFIHDLGKVAIPDAVLFKAGPLTRSEYELVKTHPAVGERICAPLRTLERARSIVRSHHETLDGQGYPDGLRGGAVPVLAQVTGIADVYDALTSDRPYRRALTNDAALEQLWREARCGKRDGDLIQEFEAVVGAEDACCAQA